MDPQRPDDPSDHLLRTLAAVPVSSSILDLGCGAGRHTEPLLRLGFPVHACDPRPAAVEATRDRVEALVGDTSTKQVVQVTPLESIEYPDETFNWVVADFAETYVSTGAELRTLLKESRRVLKPGGWLYLTLPARSTTDPESSVGEDESMEGFSLDLVNRYRKDANLAAAQDPTRIEEKGRARLRVLYRRVEPNTPA